MYLHITNINCIYNLSQVQTIQIVSYLNDGERYYYIELDYGRGNIQKIGDITDKVRLEEAFLEIIQALKSKNDNFLELEI